MLNLASVIGTTFEKNSGLRRLRTKSGGFLRTKSGGSGGKSAGGPRRLSGEVYFLNYVLQCKIMRLPIIDFRSCTSDEHFENFPEDYSDVYKTKPFLQLDFLIMYMPFLTTEITEE